jgi:serine/threonine protein kinase
MGMVYRALDIKLERLVALKFLPDEFVATKSNKERFLREARTASSLDHPNIGVIHGIERLQISAMNVSRDKLRANPALDGWWTHLVLVSEPHVQDVLEQLDKSKAAFRLWSWACAATLAHLMLMALSRSRMALPLPIRGRV